MSLTRRNFIALTASTLAAGAAGIPPAFAGSARKGTFSGRSRHVTKGTVTLKKQGGKTVVVLSDNFFFDGAPDPKIGFGKGGKYVKGTKIHKNLPKKNWKGASTHVVPASLDVDKFDEVYVWCEKFNVPLGVAKIK